MAIIKAKGTGKKKALKESKYDDVNINAQERLAEILNDSPRIVSLNGTEWQIRALRMGTQWLIAQKCIEINKKVDATFGDIVKQFATNIPAVVEIIVLALLNDKEKIYEDGNEKHGFSKLYKSTFDTLMWECNVETFGEILVDVLKLIDINFFTESHRILEIFRQNTMTRKMKTEEQK